MALLAPMPSARMSVTAAVKRMLPRIVRAVKARSSRRARMRTVSLSEVGLETEGDHPQSDMRARSLQRRNYRRFIGLSDFDVRRQSGRSGAEADSASHSRSEPSELFVLTPGQQDLGGQRADERH